MSARGAVLIMAGGTGGHIFPGLAVADALRERGATVAWLGSAGGMEARLVAEHGIELHTIAVTGLRGKGWIARCRAPWMLLRALWQAGSVLWRLRPVCVLSMGGFVAGPGGIMAWLQRRPLVVHEQNSVAGLTNRWLARVAKRVLTGFKDTLADNPRQAWIGNPVRARIAALPTPGVRLAGRPGPPRLLVLGGSLGAKRLNEVLPQALAAMPPAARPETWHQSGARGHADAAAAYDQAGLKARIEPFIDDMAEAYAWADFVVCRAGALTLAELCAAGLGALLVPYPWAVDDHQTHNAAALVAAQAARLVPEPDLEPGRLAIELAALLGDRRRLVAMAGAARELARPGAAARIADICLEVSQ